MNEKTNEVQKSQMLVYWNKANDLLITENRHNKVVNPNCASKIP